jgi:alpha-ketoglutarate-dependent taurine dioxygenase
MDDISLVFVRLKLRQQQHYQPNNQTEETIAWSHCILVGTMLSLSRLSRTGIGSRTAQLLLRPRRNLSISSEESFQNLPLRFLRDSHEDNFDPVTCQRADVSYDGASGKPSHDHHAKERYEMKSSRIVDGTNYKIEWADGVSSTYSFEWIRQAATKWQKPELSRELWAGMTESKVRNSSEMSISFYKVLHEEGISTALKVLHKFGILLVTDTPTDDGGAGIAALSSAVSGSPKKDLASTSLLENYRQGGTEVVLPNGTDGPLRTLYGSVWFTKSSVQAEGTSVADSAYGLDGLPLHTDMTYMLSPPGLQIFTMIQPAEVGGESVYADGFAAAELLRLEDPRAFEVLSSVDRTYHCIDKDTGWHLEASGPVIETRKGQIVRIRHNDLDRLPDLPPFTREDTDSESFYNELADAHAKWDDILGRDSTRLLMKLRHGDTVLVANQVSAFLHTSTYA